MRMAINRVLSLKAEHDIMLGVPELMDRCTLSDALVRAGEYGQVTVVLGEMAAICAERMGKVESCDEHSRFMDLMFECLDIIYKHSVLHSN